MNPRPILITTCVTIALVVFVYFFGKQYFSEPQLSEPVTVAKSPSTNKAPSSTANTNTDSHLEKSPNDRPLCPGCGEEFDPAKPGLHNSLMGSCVHTKNGHPCIETNLWRCQHVHRFSDGTTDEAPRHTSGPYKGMTYEQANHEWRTRYNKLQQRTIEHADKRIALTRARLKSTDGELSAILSVIALLSPEQLKIARQEVLKTVPGDQVDAFFEDLANHSSTKTPDQIAKDAEEIIAFREAYKIADRQLRVESKQIDKELEELIRDKP